MREGERQRTRDSDYKGRNLWTQVQRERRTKVGGEVDTGLQVGETETCTRQIVRRMKRYRGRNEVLQMMAKTPGNLNYFAADHEL